MSEKKKILIKLIMCTLDIAASEQKIEIPGMSFRNTMQSGKKSIS